MKKLGLGMSPLRQARLAKGLTTYDLAKEVGVSAASISRMERQLQYPSIATAARLASFLDLTLEQILMPGAVDTLGEVAQ